MVNERREESVGKYIKVHKTTKVTNIVGDNITRQEAIGSVNFTEYDLYEITEKMGAVQVPSA